MNEYTIRPDGNLDIGTVNNEPSMAQQQFKEECDINHIMNRYMQTGELVHLNAKKGVYADLTQIPDYQTALNTIIHAQSAFDTLDAKIRNRFGNDPAKLIEFLQDSKNKQEAIDLGLIIPPAQNANSNANPASDIPNPS